jgi:hypothetical protein
LLWRNPAEHAAAPVVRMRRRMPLQTQFDRSAAQAAGM